jgi:hypothetical protein
MNVFEYNNHKEVYPELGDKVPSASQYDYKTCQCCMCGILRDNLKLSRTSDQIIEHYKGTIPIPVLVPQYHIRHLEALAGIPKTGNVESDIDLLYTFVGLNLSSYLWEYRYDHVEKLLRKKQARFSNDGQQSIA